MVCIGPLAPLIGGIIAYKLAHQDVRATPPQNLMATIDLGPTEPLSLETPLPEPLGATVEFAVRRNDTLDRIFRQLKLSLTDLATIRELPGVQSKSRPTAPGRPITFVHEDGLVQELSRRISETEILSIKRERRFRRNHRHTDRDREIYAQGTIDSSLFVSARAAGVSSGDHPAAG